MSLIEEIKKQISLYGHYSPTSTPYSEIVASPDINQPQDDLKNWPPLIPDTPYERNPWDMVRCLMQDLNLNRIQACGITGNLYAESLLQNGRIQNTASGVKGPIKINGVTGYGLAQWTAQDRQQNLYDFAKFYNQRSTTPYTMYIEYNFLVWELENYGDFKDMMIKLREKTSIYEASKIILQRFERPKYNKEEWKIQERARICQRIYDYLDIEESHSIEGLTIHYKMKDVNYKPPTSTKPITPNDMPPTDEDLYKPRTWDPNKNSYEQFPETNAFGDKKAVFPEDPKTSIAVDLKYVDDEGKTVKYGQAYYTLYKETSTGKLYYTISSTGSPEGTYTPSIRDLKVYFNQ
jgi:hypothetical protein